MIDVVDNLVGSGTTAATTLLSGDVGTVIVFVIGVALVGYAIYVVRSFLPKR